MQTTIIGIAGGSGSGKSSFSNRLKEQFQDDITVIYYDNYYKDNTGIPFEERKKINYDHPDALETALLVEHLKKLRQGQAIDCPVYDYSVHNRSDKTIHIEPKPVIVVEGILTLYDPSLLEQLDVRIYVEADADERILRRLRRDVKERGRDIDGIIEQYLTTVKPMHARYVEPTRSLADLVINSGLNDIALDVVSTKIQALIDSQRQE
jgi:uridine kinase